MNIHQSDTATSSERLATIERQRAALDKLYTEAAKDRLDELLPRVERLEDALKASRSEARFLEGIVGLK